MTTAPPVTAGHPARLRAIKLLHSLVWLFFVATILGVWIFAAQGRYDRALLCIGIVLGEVVVLLVNRWSCPLTAVAARYTTERRPNFDIYLPEWLARWNKEVFGSLYAGGILYALARWRGWIG